MARGDLGLALVADPAGANAAAGALLGSPQASAWPGLEALPAADYATQYATATQTTAALGHRRGVAGVQAQVATIQQELATLGATEPQRWPASARMWTLTAEQAAGESWLAEQMTRAAPSHRIAPIAPGSR